MRKPALAVAWVSVIRTSVLLLTARKEGWRYGKTESTADPRADAENV